MARRRASRAGSGRVAKNVAKLAGAVLIALALLVGISLVPEQTAEGPRRLAGWLAQGTGRGVPVLPGLMLLLGLIWFVQESFRLGARVHGLLLAYLVGLLALHVRVGTGHELQAAAARQGGGYAGALLSIGLRRTVGEPGLWTATALGGLAAALLLSGLSVTEMLRAIGKAAHFLAGIVGAAIWRIAAAIARAMYAILWTILWRFPRAVARGVQRMVGRAWSIAAGGAGLALRVGRLGLAGWRSLGQRSLAGMARMAAGEEAVGDVPPVLRLRDRPAEAPDEIEAIPPGLERSDADHPGQLTAEERTDGVDVLPRPVRRGMLPDAVAAWDEGGHGRPGDAGSGRRRRKPGARQELLEFPQDPHPGYTLPSLSLLDTYAAGKAKSGKVDPEEVARSLERTLASFGVEAKVVRWETGPVVTRYELQPAPGVKVQRITSLQNDIALALAASSVRLEAPIPGKAAIGVELPNERPGLVHVREILTSDEFQRTSSPLTVSVGKGIAGQPVVADLVAMPHLLIAGATGAGKSVALNSMIASILFRATPEQVRLLMIDPKRVELTSYNGIPHLLSPVVTGPREAAAKLRWAIHEMESRYALFAADGVRNIQAFNAQHPDRPLAYILIIIDELADLMMIAPGDFEEIICRLAQMTRAVGIHLVVATQRPSVDVITGLIKANIPSRIAFAVTSQVDSRTILDHPGAEKLLGRGDMLFSPIGATRPTRVQGSYISDAECERLVEFWRAQGRPEYVTELMQAGEEEGEESGEEDDGLLVDAARLVVRAGYGSVSLLQRKMRIGYVRAARLIDQLEEKGIVGPSQGSSPREVLVGLSEMDHVIRAGRVRVSPAPDSTPTDG